jgi:hypothetical protein
MLGGLLLITAMVVVMKLVGEFLVSKGSIEKTGRNINHSNL